MGLVGQAGWAQALDPSVSNPTHRGKKNVLRIGKADLGKFIIK
jgi:hypothetical protein